jgi:hypothetical protein
MNRTSGELIAMQRINNAVRRQNCYLQLSGEEDVVIYTGK